jgi:hypothetical protein
MRRITRIGAAALCAALSLTAGVTRAGLLISEFLASNSTGLQDGFGAREDWIELCNSGVDAVDLTGWCLTDEPDFLAKWTFPTLTLPAGGRLVVIASGKEVVDPLGYPHASFKLSVGGGYLALVRPDGATVEDAFAPAYPEQFTDVSYGVDPTDGARRFFATPTPGTTNGVGYLGVVKDTAFSADRGFYDAPFSVTLASPTEGALIRYTTDGTKPSATEGTLYAGPVTISNTCPLRAVAYKAGWLPTDVDTHSYIFVDQVARQPRDPPGWPSDWGPDANVPTNAIPSDYEMDPRVVTNALPGHTVRDALLDIPTVSLAMLPADFIDRNTGIYANPLSRWERECSVEYILPSGAPGFHCSCKVEVHGNSSRNPFRMQKHALRLTFTTEYGPAEIGYPLFEDSPVERFNQLILRACFTDSWGLVSWVQSRYRPNDSMYIRDVWMKNSFGDMGQPTSHGSYVHLYVNGLYFGLHNLTERVGADFFAGHLGGAPEDWEINDDFASPGPRWNAMLALNPATEAGYAQLQTYLDLDNFCDYMLLHFYADAEDWPAHNGYAAANAVSDDGLFRFFVWDQEIALDCHGRAATRIDSTGGAGTLFQKLRASAEFRQRFADRVYRHCFHSGALSVSASQARYRGLADWIDKAIVAESARWGDTAAKTPYGNDVSQPSPLDDVNHELYPPASFAPDYCFTREGAWLAERDNVISNYIPAIHNTANAYALLNVLRAEDLYPDLDPPEFSQNGGEVSSHFGLTMTAAAGEIYYTPDGTDPRLEGGALSPQALRYEGVPVFFTVNPTTLKARALDGTEWSALHEAVFIVDAEPARAGNLAVSELYYNPAGSDDYEFIELQNVGSANVLLAGVRLASAVDFTFDDLQLAPGAFAVVVMSASAFSNRYVNAASPYAYAPLLVAGSWSGQLSNSGETLQLLDRDGGVIQSFGYEVGGLWPERANGYGASQERARPELPPDRPGHWRASLLYHGSPGRAGAAPDVVINEVMSRPEGGPDWVELFNAGSTPVDISGWYLSDDPSVPLKYAIPACAPLAPGAFAVFDQAAFGQGAAAFAFSSLGDAAVLTAALGTDILRVQDAQTFGPAEVGVPFGHHLRHDGSAAFTALVSPTPEATNAAPRVGPIVLGEIMYHPADVRPEYVELVNITTGAVALADDAHPTNTWQLTTAVAYAFPTGVSLVPSGRLLVTEADPAAFRAAYSVPEGVQVFGPWSGQLDNSGESLRLCKPGMPEADGTVPLIVVDRADYADCGAWPTAADGGGASLERLDLDAFGDDGHNWYASSTSRGTPGSGPDPAGEPNRYPALGDPGALAVNEGEALVARFQASDPDAGQTLTFSLQGAPPAGAALSADGELRWTPSETDGPAAVDFLVAVTDSGIPNLSDVRTVSVTVREVNRRPDLLRGSGATHTNVVPLVYAGSLWRYLDTGSDLGTQWRAPGFNDAGWSSGFARLGYGDAQKTTVGYGPSAAAKYPTTYFRHTFVLGTNAAADALWIDFGPPTSPVQAGYQRYTALHEQLATFTNQTFRAFGTRVTLAASWASNAVNDAAQMYDRGTGPSSDTPDLMRDWIGTDRRVAGNPLTLRLSGVPPGSYTWRSYHHDTLNQTGRFNVTVNDALGSFSITNVDISTGAIPLSSVSTYAAVLVSDGSDMTLVFDKLANAAGTESFFVMNAFKLNRLPPDTSGTLSSLTLSLVRDDGAIVYFNGTEVVRDNMPTGAVGYLTYASSGVGGADETAQYRYTLAPGLLADGTNTLAVEVHQSAAANSDMGFDLALEAAYLSGSPHGLTDYVVSAGEQVRFLCQSTDPDLPDSGVLYALGAGSPAGAVLDPRTGLFTWTPTAADGPSVVTFTVTATDGGVPALSDAESFRVTVLTPLRSGDVRFDLGGRLVWKAIPGDRYRIEYCDDLLAADWRTLETRLATQTSEVLADPAFLSVRQRFYRIISLRYTP